MSRYINAVLLAFVITAALFIAMRTLIIGSEAKLTEPAKGRVIDFVRLKRDETVQKKTT